MPPTKPPAKIKTAWFKCENCSTNILNKDVEQHREDCPPNTKKISYSFVHSNTLYSSIDHKINEDIKAIHPQDRDNMVFLSQSAIQLCNLAIGDWAVVRHLNIALPPLARIVWPTSEKSVASVLFTKNAFSMVQLNQNNNVSVSKISGVIREAKLLTLIVLNDLKIVELSNELINRIHKLCLGRLLTKGNQISVLFYGKQMTFKIKTIESFKGHKVTDDLKQDFANLSIENPLSEFFKIVENTKLKLFRSETEFVEETQTKNLLSKIGGLDSELAEIAIIMNAVLNPATNPKLRTARGVLLYGASGTGKTLVTNAIAKSSTAYVVSISTVELYSKNISDPEESLKTLYHDAVDHAPSIFLIDEIDLLCPPRNSRISDKEKRIVSGFLNIFDQINEQHLPIFVLATSNKPDSIDQAFRRCARLDREIEIPTPNPKGRLDILGKILEDVQNNLSCDDLTQISNAAHGFVGADLVALCSTAALQGHKRGVCQINFEDLKYALKQVKPSAMREVQIEVPDVKWSDIGGQENLKLILRQAVEWPLKYPQSFIRMGITPPRGVLMFGPPGCSKTMIAKALATESGLNFLSIKGPELFSKWVGESERGVREVFRKARQVAPSIIFFDEIDALGGERSAGSSTSVHERVLAQLLTELDGVTPLGDVTVLAATNRPDRIDKALLRPGRLDRIVYVPLPDDDTRREIFKLKLEKMPVSDRVIVNSLVSLTEGYSGAEINAVCHEAAMKALEESLEADQVKIEHFQKALHIISPRTSPSLLEIYKNYVKS